MAVASYTPTTSAPAAVSAGASAFPGSAAQAVAGFGGLTKAQLGMTVDLGGTGTSGPNNPTGPMGGGIAPAPTMTVGQALTAYFQMSPSDQAGLAQQLWQAGMFAQSMYTAATSRGQAPSILPGDIANAYGRALLGSAEAAQSFTEFITQSTTVTDQMLGNVGTIPSIAGSGPPGGTHVYPGGKVTISQTDPETIRLAANATAQSLLGRNLTDAEAQRVVTTVRSDELKKGTQQASADEATRQATIQTNEQLYGTAPSGGGGVTGGAGTPTATQLDAAGRITTEQWATALLQQINADGHNVPVTQNNIQNVMRWMASEEPASSWLTRNNPLNASVGSGSADGTGAQPSVSQGIANTAGMIEQGNMAAILGALQSDAAPQSFTSAVVSTPWASSHYGGGANFSAQPLVSTSAPGGQGAGGLQAVTGAQAITPGGSKGTGADVFLPPTLANISTPVSPQGAATQQIQTQDTSEMQNYAAQKQIQNFTTALHSVPGDTGAATPATARP